MPGAYWDATLHIKDMVKVIANALVLCFAAAPALLPMACIERMVIAVAVAINQLAWFGARYISS